MAQATQPTEQRITTTGCVVIATGELDIATAPALDEALNRAMNGCPDPHLVVDLHGVTFMDCAGLRPLLRARNRIQGQLWLRNVSPPAARLLALAGLTHTFVVVSGVPEPAAHASPVAGRFRTVPPRQRRNPFSRIRRVTLAPEL